MSALSNVHASTLLNTSLRSGTYYLALFLTDPTASGTGTEGSGGGYARKIINFSAPSLVSGKEQVSNSAPVDFGTLTADLGTVAYWGIYDALTAGNLLWYGSFTRSKNVLNGDAITVSAGLSFALWHNEEASKCITALRTIRRRTTEQRPLCSSGSLRRTRRRIPRRR